MRCEVLNVPENVSPLVCIQKKIPNITLTFCLINCHEKWNRDSRTSRESREKQLQQVAG